MVLNTKLQLIVLAKLTACARSVLMDTFIQAVDTIDADLPAAPFALEEIRLATSSISGAV